VLEYRFTHALLGACQQYNVTLPDYLVAARLTHDQAKELAGWMSFAQPLMEALRSPFNVAAVAFTGGDQTALPTLCALATVRDLLAELWPPPRTDMNDATALHVRSQADGGEFERCTRVLDVGGVIMAECLLPCAVRGLERGSAAWFAAALTVPGVEISWQSPSEAVPLTAELRAGFACRA
jgi:hypothetical protein